MDALGSAENHMHQLSVKIRAKDLMGLVESQGYRCALTGRELEPETACPDHKHPISRGGDACDIDNIQIIYREVNQAKGRMMHEDFIQMCREVVAWADGEHD